MNIENQTDRFCLHYVFLPRINADLDSFRLGWNSHSLSTQGNWSPLQLFTAHSHGNPLFIDDNNDFNDQMYGYYGIQDPEENGTVDESETANVPPCLYH